MSSSFFFFVNYPVENLFFNTDLFKTAQFTAPTVQFSNTAAYFSFTFAAVLKFFVFVKAINGYLYTFMQKQAVISKHCVEF